MIHLYDGMAVCRRKFDTDPLGRGPRNLVTEVLTLPRSDVAIWVFEGRGHLAERRKILPSYKDRPSTMTDGLHALVDLTRKALRHTRALQVAVPGREADDVIAHLCGVYGTGAGDGILVHTVDRDLLALAGPKVRVDVKPLKICIEPLDPTKDVILQPWEIPLYKVLVGDPSDRVPGMPRFGGKGFAACNRRLLAIALQALIAGHPQRDLFMLAGVKEAMAARMCEPAQAELLRAYHRVVGFLPMPEDWDQHVVPGVENPAAATAALAEFGH